MSFFLLVDAKFVVKRDFISRIIEILKAYKVIIENGGSVDDIDMVISKWSPSKSTALILPNLSSLRNSHGSIITFKHEYTKYITTNCLILVQTLIEMYTIDVSIARLALQNLLSITVLQSEMDSVSVMQSSRVRYAKRISNISSFICDEIPDIVYRELYFAYLSKKRDDELHSSNKDLIDLSYSSILEFFQSTVPNQKVFRPSFVWSNLDNLIFDDHIRNLEDINSLRIVNKELNEHFNFSKIKSIVTENLMDVLENFFLLNSCEFSKLIAKIGAIISGSAIEQSSRGGALKFRDDSDLDVYVRDDANEFVMFITGAGYEAVESYEQPTIAHTTHFYSNKLGYRFNSSIVGVYNFKNGKGRKIQMILIADADDLTNYEFGQYIVSMYDFTFLMNFYDGNNLYIHDYQGIVKKCGAISDFVIQKCTYRDEDGFQVGAPKGAIRIWYCAITATIIRCFKYETLGYKIKNIPSLSLVTQLNVDTDLN